MSDKNTIGLTPANGKIVEQLIEAGVFRQDLDAAKFALSIAIAQSMPIGDAQGAGTKWNVGSFDRENQLKELVLLFYPETKEPYRAMEFFVNAGLEAIAQRMKSKPGFDVGNLLSIATVP